MHYVVDPYWVHYLACIAMIRVVPNKEKGFWLLKAIELRFDILFGDEPDEYMYGRVINDLNHAVSLNN